MQVYTATKAPEPTLDPFVMLDAPDLSKKPEESYGAPDAGNTFTILEENVNEI